MSDSRSHLSRSALGRGALLIALALTAPLGLVSVAAADPPRVITLAGSLQSELGCPGDWQPACDASELPQTGPGTYAVTVTLPAGSYEFKITVDGSWDENYGLDGVADGANIPLVLAGDAQLAIAYDDTTHRVTLTPTDLPGDAITKADRQLARDSLRNKLTKERFYFVMSDRFANGDRSNDRGGLTGSRLQTGLDPHDKGFFHGGDLKGLIGKLDYIKDLGSTAIWLTPSFKNRPVQGTGSNASAGYHGYWITDFTQIDPHLGTNADMKKLINEAHKRKMKVFFDIITNHTADVIDYRENAYTYVSKGDSPYTDANGTIFDDAEFADAEDFPAMDPATSFPYTPYFGSAADAQVKVPTWLNDPSLYHNRGDTTYSGESSTYGDFSGLDDLFTENRAVVDGMIDIYNTWVDSGIDGFRIDTVKHVNTEFWQRFSPAVDQHAAARGNKDFFMFGEVFDGAPAVQSTYSTTGKLPATLDFGFQGAAVAAVNGSATSSLADLFAGDDYYTDTDSNAYNLPTFLGNHDMGRIGSFVGGSLAKDRLAHQLMFTLRGQPVVYYGDEQGFIGDGGDKDARQDMFASQVDSYNDDPMIGGVATGARDRFGRTGPMFRTIKQLSTLRAAHPALADGAQTPRFSSNTPGIFAVSRVDRRQQVEYLVVANTSEASASATFATYSPQTRFRPLYGGGSAVRSGADAQVSVTVPAMSVRVLKADRGIPRSRVAPDVAVSQVGVDQILAGRAEIRAAVPANQPVQVSFAYRPVGSTAWQSLGTDDNAPYRVFHDVTGQAAGTLLEYRVVVKDNRGHLSASSSWGTVGNPPPATGGAVGDVDQPAAVSVPGTLGSEMGCGADWTPDCEQAQLTLDPDDEIWKGSYTLPVGPYAYKAAINKTWDENYGASGVPNGANIELTSTGTPITFYYDHRTHIATSTAQGPIVVAAGSFQSEMGCPADDDAGCLRSWLTDPDGDGVFTLSTTQIPAGSYTVRSTTDGTAVGAEVSFTVDGDGLATTLRYDSATQSTTVSSAAPAGTPDLATAQAYWLNQRTIAYPVSRLGSGVDPHWLRFGLHWGDLAIDDTSIGGRSTPLAIVRGAPEGYVALRVDRRMVPRLGEIRRAPMSGVGVYDDAHQLIDATGVRRS